VCVCVARKARFKQHLAQPIADGLHQVEYTARHCIIRVCVYIYIYICIYFLRRAITLRADNRKKTRQGCFSFPQIHATVSLNQISPRLGYLSSGAAGCERCSPNGFSIQICSVTQANSDTACHSGRGGVVGGDGGGDGGDEDGQRCEAKMATRGSGRGGERIVEKCVRIVLGSSFVSIQSVMDG